MESYPNKYSRFIVNLFLFAPIVSYIFLGVFKKDFTTTTTILSIVGIFILLLFRNKKNTILVPKHLIFLFLFVVYMILTDYFLLGKKFDAKILYADRLVGSVYILFLIENFKVSKKYYDFIIRHMKPILILAILVIIVQQGYKDSFLVNPDYQKQWGGLDISENRLPSIYSYLGGGVSLGLGFIPLLIILVENLNKNKKNITFWILGGVIFAFLSKYRWIMLNSLLLFIILMINNKTNFFSILKYLILVPVFFISTIFILKTVGIHADNIIKERILEKDTEKGAKSYTTRVLAFYAFNQLFWDNPIFGVGNVKYGIGGSGKQDYKLRRILGGQSSQLHVGYLSLFYYYGIVGGILYIGFMYNLLYKKLYLNAKRTKMFGPFLGMLCFAIANLTLVNLSINESGLIIAIVVDNYYLKNFNNKNQRKSFVKK